MEYIDDPRVLEAERTGYLDDYSTNLEIVSYCNECGKPIYECEEYVLDEVTGEAYCEECFKDRFSHKTA